MHTKPGRMLIILILCLLLPLGLSAAAEETALQYDSIPVQAFSVRGVTPQEETVLSWYYSPFEDCRYLFLPACADRSRLTLCYAVQGGGVLSLNGIDVASGAETDLLASGDLFTLSANGTDCGTLRVMQSTLGSVFVSLGEGVLDRLDSDRSAKAAGTVQVLSAEGTVQYSGALASFGGRGHSSWEYADKKPYHMELAEKASLFEMDSARKWELLSNQLDESMLRNELAFAMARAAGLCFTPDSVFTDLYIDGDYRGTYQLTERTEVNPGRVELRDLGAATRAENPLPLRSYERITAGNAESAGGYAYFDIPNDPVDITGGYLLRFELPESATHGLFTTARGQICEIVSPKYPTKAQTEYLRGFVQELEDAIYAETGCNTQGRHFSEYLDTDSVLLGWLVQEITENPDGAATSFYFYKDSDRTGDGLLHYGPVWDFDLAYMNYRVTVTDPAGAVHYSGDPQTLFALYRHSGAAAESLLLKLWQRDDLAVRAAVLYEEWFEDMLTAMTDCSRAEGALPDTLCAALSPSAEMNTVRWQGYHKPIGAQTGSNHTEAAAYVRTFLAQRQRFLRELFTEESIARCGSILEALFAAHPAEAYDPAEQVQRTALCSAAAEAIGAADCPSAAYAALCAAESALAELPEHELSGDFDLDGAVTVADAQAVLNFYVASLGGYHPAADATQRRNGDVDRDGVLTAADATCILIRYTEGLSRHRVECGEWSVE